MALGGILAERCFAIGDIHGHSLALKGLLRLLERSAKLTSDDTLIFLGDYVDRGPDDAGVLDLVMELERSRPRTIALLGNHDAWRIAGMTKPEVNLWLRQRPHYFRWDRYFFSHAPVYTVPSAEYLDRLPWAYWSGFETFQEAVTAGYDFLNSYQGFSADVLLKEEGVISVCGHVHHESVRIYADHAIGVDTGCGFGGRLSAIELPSLRVWSVTEDGVE